MEAYCKDPNMDNDDDEILALPEEMTIVSNFTATYALITL